MPKSFEDLLKSMPKAPVLQSPLEKPKLTSTSIKSRTSSYWR